MSLVSLIRDYVDSSKQLDGYTFSSLAHYTLSFLFSILKQGIVNFCTFQWIRDFSYFCLTPPMLFSSFANINISEGVISESIRSEHQSLSNLVAFSETNFLNGIGLIFLGFFNGCFTSIHICAANLVTIQRLLVQGVPAGLCSALGTAIGQCCFLACVHFGFRTLLFPWLSVEPLPFLLGMGILLAIASNSAQDRRTPTIQWSAKSFLLTYTFTSITLAWCEQTALFQLMGNLSFGAEPTLLETTPSPQTIATIFGNIQQVIKNGSYLLAFFLGNFLGTFFLAYALQRLLELLLSFKGIPIYYGLIKQANLPLATLIFAFGFGSLPYYGFDYLITKGFGFLPQEQFFQQTLFSPINLVSKTSQTKEPTQGRLEDQLALLFTLEGEKNKSFVVDTTPFDDGQYLKAGQKRPQAFEDLNYRGEHLWTNRLSRISNIREQANQTQSSFLGPVFSWIRSFLWGEGPTTSNSSFNKNILAVSDSSTSQAPKGAKGSSAAYPEGGKQAHIAERRGVRGTETPSLATPDSSLTRGVPLKQEAALHFGEENTKRKKELSVEREQFDNYVKEFDRQFDRGFSNFHNVEPISLIEVEDQWQEERIKKKCYTNPIYTFLLNVEIDSFLGRQPNYHRLSAEEEILLLKRRQLLSNYYDSLALTSQIPTSQAFNEIITGKGIVPASYSNAIYNHQFKGTLKIARRLFSINLNNARAHASKNAKDSKDGFLYTEGLADPPRGMHVQQLEKSRIIKFDQPLFSKEKILPIRLKQEASEEAQPQGVQRILAERGGGKATTTTNSIIFHEELAKRKPLSKENERTVQNNSGVTSLNASAEAERRALSSQERQTPDARRRELGILAERGGGKATTSKEGGSKVKNSRDSDLSSPYLLEQAESLPLYASWDEGLRKLILTNRFQSRIKAGYAYSTGQDFPTAVPSIEKDSSDVSFTAWPLQNPLLFDESFYSAKESANNPAPLPRFANTETPAPPQALQHIPAERGKGNTTSKTQFLFSTPLESAPNDMINALLQWEKLMNGKQFSNAKDAAKKELSYWPKNIRRANWSTELMDNDIEFDEPAENILKEQIILWEFIPPNYGGFIWPGIK